jgi:catechol 2,3-dioxygenase-like lactoylglutathione lyase family enzyme
MASSLSFGLADQSNLRVDRQNSYLRVHAVNVFVRDLDRSLQFYLEQLGFTLAFDVCLQSGQRWVGVAPPDGTAVLTLVAPPAESEEYKLIGRPTGIAFVAEDVAAKYKEWRQRGVRFSYTPRLRRVKYQRQAPDGSANAELPQLGKQPPIWGGVFTRFEDIDRNSFALVSFDEMSRAVEAQRQAAAERLESERRAAHELEIAKQVQARLFPQVLPPLKTLDYAGLLHSGPPGGRRLLRLSQSRPGAARVGAGRYFGKGDRWRTPDGQSAGESAQPVRHRLG